jgi:D-amino-acid dehydrogenase
MKSALVLGAGLQGICTAYFLSKHGLEVTLIERNEGPALEASMGNGGYLQAEFPEIWNAPGIAGVLAKAWRASLGSKRHEAAMLVNTKELLRLVPWGLRFLRSANIQSFLKNTLTNRVLAQYSLEQMAELRAQTGIAYDHAQQGAVFIFRDIPSMDAYRPLLEHLDNKGGCFEFLDQRRLLALEPALQPIGEHLAGAIHYQNDASGNSYLFAQSLLDLAIINGVRVKYGAPVLNIRKQAQKVSVQLKDEVLEANALVIAAGSESKLLAQQLGIKLHIAPAKGYSLTIPLGHCRNRPSHVIADMGVHAGITVLGDVLRVAGTAEFCGYDYSLPNQRIEYLLKLTEQILPDFAATMDPTKVSPFAGLRPLSADGMPFIGSSQFGNVFINTGHGGLGWTQAAGSGRALADIIAGVKPGIDLAPFAPTRSV